MPCSPGNGQSDSQASADRRWGWDSRGAGGEHPGARGSAKGTGLVLFTLAAGQFLMTLDSSVMNVSIATVAKDVGTTVTGIQTAITLYTLVMAMFMITGGKVGSIIGAARLRDRLVIYGAGSLTTALAPNLAVLVLGWSLLEGIGAALIMPAIVALVAGNFNCAVARGPTGWSWRPARSRSRSVPDRRLCHHLLLVAVGVRR